MKHCAKLATLVVLTLSLATACAASLNPPQNTQAPDQSQQMEKPPHADVENSSADRDLERTIKDALGQDPHMAYSRVSVLVTDKEVVLAGVVLTGTAKSQAAQIAKDHAAGRKVTNRIKVNPNTHPAGGF